MAGAGGNLIRNNLMSLTSTFGTLGGWQHNLYTLCILLTLQVCPQLPKIPYIILTKGPKCLLILFAKEFDLISKLNKVTIIISSTFVKQPDTIIAFLQMDMDFQR